MMCPYGVDRSTKRVDALRDASLSDDPPFFRPETSINIRIAFLSGCFLTSSVWVIHLLNYHIVPADH
jgi:capsular polysaccharide biosynthesis protein